MFNVVDTDAITLTDAAVAKVREVVEAQGQEIAELKAALREQTAQLRKVNELVQARIASPRLVENGR